MVWNSQRVTLSETEEPEVYILDCVLSQEWPEVVVLHVVTMSASGHEHEDGAVDHDT